MTKYRSVADMPGPPPARSPLAGIASACALSEMSSWFGPVIVGPRGIRKFRSIEEMSAAREAWEGEAVRQRAAFFAEAEQARAR